MRQSTTVLAVVSQGSSDPDSIDSTGLVLRFGRYLSIQYCICQYGPGCNTGVSSIG